MGVYESWLDALFLVFKKHREKPPKRLRKIIVCGCPAFLEKRLLKYLDLFSFENSIEWGKFQRKEERDPKCASRGPQREWNLPGEFWAGEAGPSAGHAEQILKPSAAVYPAPALSLSSQHIRDVYWGMTSLSGLRSSLSQEDLPVHPGSIINLASALSSEPLSEQGPFSTLPPLSKHFLFTFSASSARICSKAGGSKRRGAICMKCSR